MPTTTRTYPFGTITVRLEVDVEGDDLTLEQKLEAIGETVINAFVAEHDRLGLTHCGAMMALIIAATYEMQCIGHDACAVNLLGGIVSKIVGLADDEADELSMTAH